MGRKKQQVVEKEVEKKAPVVTKTVKMPLMVTMTGSKESLDKIGGDLVEKLKESLPMTMRLGRGRKETISISSK